MISKNNPLTTALLLSNDRVVEDVRTPDRYTVVSVSSPQQGEITPEAPVTVSTETSTEEEGLAKNLFGESEPYRRVIFVVIPVFMAYACLFALQGKLKTELNVECGASEDEAFGRAVSALYMGNLIFRFAHNFILFPLSPRGRTCLSIMVLGLSMSVIAFGIFIFKIHNLSLVWLAYGLGGIGIGSFESNLLSAITPLGHRTKLWATLGIPAGVVLITVGSFVLFAVTDVPVLFVYLLVLCLLVCSLILFLCAVPYVQVQDNGDSFRAFLEDLRQWRQWLPQTQPYVILRARTISHASIHIVCKSSCEQNAFARRNLILNFAPQHRYAFCLAIDMLCVSTFSPGVMLYIFPKGSLVNMLGTKIKTDVFFALYNACTFLGEIVSRSLAYKDRNIRTPYIFLIFSFLGVAINLVFSKIWWVPSMFPLAGFLIFFANGSIYNRACRNIDSNVPKSFNLTALSFWLFLGDTGSVTGANIMQYLKQWMVGTISC